MNNVNIPTPQLPNLKKDILLQETNFFETYKYPKQRRPSDLVQSTKLSYSSKKRTTAVSTSALGNFHSPPRIPPVLPNDKLLELSMFNQPSAGKNFTADQLNSMTSELHDKMSAALSDINTPDSLEQLLNLFNMSFNQIILAERNHVPEKGILLRQIQKYYNSLIGQLKLKHKERQLTFPSTNENSQICEEDLKVLQKRNQELLNTIDEMKGQQKETEFTITDLKRQIVEKDTEIQTIQFELDYTKGALTTSQYEVTNKNNDINGLQKAVDQRDEEIQKQTEMIDSLSLQIEKLQNGDAGYIHLYSEEKQKVEKEHQLYEELKKEFDSYKFRSMVDVETCTRFEENPVLNSSRFKIGRVKPSESIHQIIKNRRLGIIPEDNANSLTDKNQDFGITLPMKLGFNDSTAHLPVRENRRSSFGEETKQKTHQHSSISSENSTLTLFDLMNIPASNPVFNPLDTKMVSVQTTISCFDKVKLSICDANIEIDEFNNDSILSFSNDIIKIAVMPTLPDQNPTDETQEIKIPNIMKMCEPYYSIAPVKLEKQIDLNRLFLGNFDTIVKNARPISWLLRVIHTFLTDSFTRSLQNKENCVESIFYEWVQEYYKVRPVILQTFADFSYNLTRYRQTDKMASFFFDLLAGDYNFSQLAVLSTIYQFTVNLTSPSFLNLLKNPNLAAGQEYPTISHELASSILTKMFDVEKEAESSDYIDFLHETMVYFSEKHSLLNNQIRSLLSLCGCQDVRYIYVQSFYNFHALLNLKTNRKEAWEKIVHKNASNIIGVTPTINLHSLIWFCTEERTPIRFLLKMDSIGKALERLKKSPQLIMDLYDELKERYANVLLQVCNKLSPKIIEQINPLMDNLGVAILDANIPKILFLYRNIITKIDRLTMKELGFIPLSPRPSLEQMTSLREYLDKTESVAFALLQE